jgi:hypothetical protein
MAVTQSQEYTIAGVISSYTAFILASPRGSLTMVVHEPIVDGEQATSSYSFRSPELSQPI